LTAWIRKTLTPSDIWKERNEDHLELSVDAAKARLLTGTATRPVVPRIRFTGRFEDASPHKQVVGEDVDLSGLVIKSDSHLKQ